MSQENRFNQGTNRGDSKSDRLRMLTVFVFGALTAMVISFGVQPIKGLLFGEKEVIKIVEVPVAQTEGGFFENPSSQPKVLNLGNIRKEIGYPKAAREAGIQGAVLVRVWVDKQGKYIKHELLNRADQILADAVEAQVPNLSFNAAQVDGKTVDSSIEIPFTFRLLK